MNIKKYMYLMAAGLTMTACSNEDFTSGNGTGDKDVTEVSGFGGNIVDGLDVLDTEGCEGEKAGRLQPEFLPFFCFLFSCSLSFPP